MGNEYLLSESSFSKLSDFSLISLFFFPSRQTRTATVFPPAPLELLLGPNSSLTSRLLTVRFVSQTLRSSSRSDFASLLSRSTATIQGLKLSKNIPIGTADAGSAVTTPLCAGADFIVSFRNTASQKSWGEKVTDASSSSSSTQMANVHPWFGSVDVAGAAAWTTNFFKEFDTDICAASTTNNA